MGLARSPEKGDFSLGGGLSDGRSPSTTVRSLRVQLLDGPAPLGRQELCPGGAGAQEDEGVAGVVFAGSSFDLDSGGSPREDPL